MAIYPDKERPEKKPALLITSLILDFLNSEWWEDKFLLFKPPSLKSFFWEPKQTDTGSWLPLSAWLLMFSSPYYLQMSKFLEVNCIAEHWVHFNINTFPFPLMILCFQVLVVLLNSRFFPSVLWDHRKFRSASSLRAIPFCLILRRETLNCLWISKCIQGNNGAKFGVYLNTLLASCRTSPLKF